MHSSLWPHFAPSSDGNRITGRWPTFPNNQYHSFEAHNDWAQFLEEYGLIGLGLFLLAIGTALAGLFRRWRRWAFIQASYPDCIQSTAWVLPGMLLAALAMAIHSIGDFNLQLPGTTWLMGILAGLAVAIARLTPPFRVKQSNTKVPEIIGTSSQVDRDLRARSDAARRSASTSGCLDYYENVSKSVEKGQAP
jgi:O-antigen ligase